MNYHQPERRTARVGPTDTCRINPNPLPVGYIVNGHAYCASTSFVADPTQQHNTQRDQQHQQQHERPQTARKQLNREKQQHFDIVDTHRKG